MSSMVTHCVQLKVPSVVDVGAIPHCQQRLTEGASDVVRDAHVLAATGLQFSQMQCSAAGKLSRVQSDRICCQFAHLARPITNCSHTKAVSKPTRCSR